LLLIVSTVGRLELINEVFAGVFWASTTLTMMLGRLMLYYALAKTRFLGSGERALILVGTNSRALKLATEITAKPELGYSLLGFVDDVWQNTPRFNEAGYRFVTTIDGFPDYLRTRTVDEVLICLPMKSGYHTSEKIVKMCEEQGVRVGVLSDIFPLEVARSRVDHVGANSIIGGNVWVTSDVAPGSKIVQFKPRDAFYADGSGI
jgi:FlaA1/EpsC-like NDP-sugar epimerase